MDDEVPTPQPQADSPTTDPTPQLPSRRCAYGRCGEPLDYDGKGRPPEYCPDRRWPDGKSCKQLAAVERDATRAAGLEVPLETFRALADRLAPAAQVLAEQLQGVLAAMEQIDEGALARMVEAERLVESAQRETESARAEAVSAAQRQRAAEQARERSQAQERSAIAAARQTHAEADEQVRKAWEVASQADQAKGRAEAHAVDAEDARNAEAYRREQAEQQTQAAALEVVAAREELAQLRHREETARREVSHLTVLIDRAAADHADVANQVNALDRELSEQRRQNVALLAAVEKANTHAATTLSHAAVTEATATAAVERAESAERRAASAEARLDALVARLSGRPPHEDEIGSGAIG
jgi:chromosome segregation ATPase